MRPEPPSSPNPRRERAVALVALLPVLVAATSTGTGVALGAAVAVVLLATTVVATTFAELAAAARLALCAAVAGALAICADLLSHALLPDLRALLGPFLLATAPTALLLIAGAPQPLRFAAAPKAALLALGSCVAVGAVRELLGRGTLLGDLGLLARLDAGAWQLPLPWGGFLAATELPGALLAAALLLVLAGPHEGARRT